MKKGHRNRASSRGSALLNELESIKTERNPQAADRKEILLCELASKSIGDFSGTPSSRAKSILRYHETLCYLYAYPDNAAVFLCAEEALRQFSAKITQTLAKHLEGTGLAGTTIKHPFEFPIAKWLCRLFPDNPALCRPMVEIAWKSFDNVDRLQSLLPQLTRLAEELGVDDEDTSTREWIENARGSQTGLAWLVGALNALDIRPTLRDMLYDALEMPIVWRIAPTASRTGAIVEGSPVFYHDVPFARGALDLAAEIVKPVQTISLLSGRNAELMIDLAKAALCSREREMYPLSHSNAADVTLYTLERGLQVAAIGTLPERRMLLECLWGFLILKNGMLIGYGAFSTLFESSEVAFNIFDSFRHGEAGLTYAGLLNVIHHHTGARSFTALKFQFGYNNDEAIESGAFWFYHKLGFRPLNAVHAKKVEAEYKKVKSTPGYRSSKATLKKLAEENLYFSLDGENCNVLGHLPYSKIGLAVTRMIARDFGGDRGLAVRQTQKSVRAALGLSLVRHELTDELILFLALFEDLPLWSAKEKFELVQIIEAKSENSEQDFVLRMNRHARLKERTLSLL